VIKSQKWRRVELEIKKFVDEAKEILEEFNFPTSFEGLGEIDKKHHKRLTLEAELVVHAEYYLQQAIENNKADESAMRMLSLLVAYLRMKDLRDAPESKNWMKLGYDEDEVRFKALNAGLKNLLRNKEKIKLPDGKNAIRQRAIQLRNENPEFYNYQIKDILAKEFKVSKSLIEKIKKLIPKRTPKKKNI